MKRERGEIFEKERWKKIRVVERLTEREKSCLEQTLPLSSVFFYRIENPSNKTIKIASLRVSPRERKNKK